MFYQNNVYPHKPWDVDVFTLALPADDNKHALRQIEAHDDNDQNHQARLSVTCQHVCVWAGVCVQPTAVTDQSRAWLKCPVFESHSPCFGQ